MIYLRYIFYNLSLASIFNTFDGYIRGNGYKFYLSQQVLVCNRVAEVYHRWTDPFGSAFYCIQFLDTTDCEWDLTEKDMIPFNSTTKILYGLQ